MEFTLNKKTTLRERRAQLLQWYGSEEGLRRAADEGDIEAQDGLVDLAIIKEVDEDPDVLDAETTMEEDVEFDDTDLAKLTPARWRLMEAIGEGGKTMAELGRELGRDKKNISDDIRILAGLGLVTAHRQGRVKRAWLRGDELRLRLPRREPV